MFELTKRWVREGHKVTVVTAPYEKSDIVARGFVDEQFFEGIKVKVIDSKDSNRHSFARRAINALKFSAVSSWFALCLDYEVIVCSSGPLSVGLPGILSSKLRGKKFVFEVRDLWPAGAIEMKKITSQWQIKLALWFEKVCYKSASLVVTASPDQQAHIVNRFPLLKTMVIPNASDIDVFGADTSSEKLPVWTNNKHIFTYIGSLGFIHNCKLIIESAIHLQGANDKILIVLIGDGDERNELEEMANTYQLKNVFFLGKLPKMRLPLWVQNSKATLFTTLNNPVQNSSSPNKVFDSLAAGTPVIQTTEGWLSGLITDEKCGLNVLPDNAQALADAMIKIVSNPNLQKELSSNAYRVANTFFNRDKLAEKYLSALKNLMTPN